MRAKVDDLSMVFDGLQGDTGHRIMPHWPSIQGLMSYPAVSFLAQNWDAVLISIICFVLGLMYLRQMRGQA